MSGTVERFHRVQSLFNLVLAAPESRRAALLDEHCGSDSELEDEIRSMLDACDAEEQLNASLRSRPGNCAAERREHERVGPYEIDRLLGRGGMGSVYSAHRADGHFDQKVAIKLIDVPVGSHLFRERLRQERQILAGLQHPYIARLLNGGVAAEGCPYLAMEYVEGVPIQRFCEEHRLNQTQRIELFLRVCDAVQFAHQNFVVHRDLKPDNILVVADGTPRLLDFGTAKLVSPSLHKHDSELTRVGYLSFTPQYASPEQVLGKPITAACDTYALGVLLYLLLTGKLPYRFEELTTEEMLRIICEEAPARPCQASGRRLDSDLEAILLKALRKEPQERYPTVEQLSEDLRAYLDRRPVGACRGTLRYRASKFARRHSFALASVGVLAATLTAGVIAVGWQARVANGERQKAEARSADLRQLSSSLLTELDDAIQQLPGSTNAQKLLVTRVLEHLDRMAKDARGDRETELDLAAAYTRLGNLQGNDYFQNLGDTPGALTSIDKAIALETPLIDRNPKDREAFHALAVAQSFRGEILFGAAPIEQAIASTQASIATYKRLAGIPGETPNEILDASSAYVRLGDEIGIVSTGSLNNLPGALSAYRKAVELMQEALRINPSLMIARRRLVLGQSSIATIDKQTDPELALKDTQTAMQLLAALPKEEQDSLPMARERRSLLFGEATLLVELGEYSDAMAIEADAVRTRQKLVAADPLDSRALFDLLFALDRQAMLFETEANPELGATPGNRRRDLASAEKPLAQEVALAKEMLKRNPSQDELRPILAMAQVRLGSVQSVLHGGKDAAELVKTGLSEFRRLVRKNPDSPSVLGMAAESLLVVEPASLRDPQFTVFCAEHAADLSHRRFPDRLLTLAQAYRASGQIGKSQATAKEGLALLPAQQPGSLKPRIRKLLEVQAGSGL